MKKITVLLLFVLCSTAFANVDEKLRHFNFATSSFSGLFNNNLFKALLGDHEILDSSLDIFSLARLTNEQLRLLRNMIFARYGLRFNSSDLIEYFNMFSWYNPVSTNVDNYLTEIDLRNINFIQAFESRNVYLPNANWDDRRIGIWQAMPIVGSGWAGRFVFHSNNNMEFRASQMGSQGIFRNLSGEYRIIGNILEFNVNRIYYLMHDGNIEMGFSGFRFINVQMNTITLTNPIVFKFPISSISTENAYFWDRNVGIRDQVIIGNTRFYRMSTTTED